jgi:ribose transport system ATP-binding protein
MQTSIALKVEGLSKRYGATVALNGVSFSVNRGEAHALIGENGAGKSTLIKILSGGTHLDAGSISIDDRPVSFRSAGDARSAGIATAFQELTLVPQLTVAQNLFLGAEPLNRFHVASNRSLSHHALERMTDWGLEKIDPEVTVETLPLGVQQQLELVRAFAQQPEVLLLDEPTAALGTMQVDWLFEQLAVVRKRGGTVLFISHRMSEVRAVCDRATVLRGGVAVRTFIPTDVSDDEVVKLMLGQAIEKVVPRKVTSPKQKPVLVVENLVSGRDLQGASLTLSEGELVGVAALQGQGQYELFMTMFGARRASGGQIHIDGKLMKLKSPRDAVAAGIGIGLVPEDRKTEGIILGMSGRRNVTLSSLKKLSRFGFIRTRAERDLAHRIFESVNVRLSALEDPVSALSGGNQQKLAIGKWLTGNPRFMLMYDPTRGVDVGTKSEIFQLMHRLCADGAAILFYSTDIEELIAASHRILVMYRGKVVHELVGDEMQSDAVLTAMLGQGSPRVGFEESNLNSAGVS